MPAVAQINVNFANRQEFTINIPAAGVTTTKAISPYTLLQYMLYNREQEPDDNEIPGPSDSLYYTYPGGFITAGDKINVKHNDLQLLSNLDMSRSIFCDTIFARKKGLDDDYQLARTGNERSVNISPFENNTTNNFINILTSGSNRTISLVTQDNSSRQNKIEIQTTPTSRIISIVTSALEVTNDSANFTGTMNVIDNVTFNRNFTINGSASTGEERFVINNGSISKFSVDSATGNTDIQGTLNVEGSTEIDDVLNVTGNFTIPSASSSKFSVMATSGNTNIQGTLEVVDNVTLKKNVTIEGSTSTGTERFIINDGSVNKFVVDSTTGNTNIEGTLTVVDNVTLRKNVTIEGSSSTGTERFIINNGLEIRFVVDSTTGNTDIEGKLDINDSITMTNPTKANKRIIGVRRVDGPNDIFDENNIYQTDALAIGDFRLYAFQRGMIIMFNGNLGTGLLTTPTGGWALCTGQTVFFNGANVTTPDLRGRFIIGTGGSYSYTNTGGSETITLNLNQIPSHKHNVSVNTNILGEGGHTHRACQVGTRTYESHFPSDGNNQAVKSIDFFLTGVQDAGTHTHTADSTVSESFQGGSQSHSNMPPYYALAFIMKL